MRQQTPSDLRPHTVVVREERAAETLGAQALLLPPQPEESTPESEVGPPDDPRSPVRRSPLPQSEIIVLLNRQTGAERGR